MPVPGTISDVTRFTAPWTSFVSRIMFSVDLSPGDLLGLGPTKAKHPQFYVGATFSRDPHGTETLSGSRSVG